MRLLNRESMQYLATASLVILAGSVFASDYNVYFSDPSAGLIYGMADDDAGQLPTVVSGQLSLNLSHLVQLDNNHVIVSPEYHPDTLWEINYITNSMTEIEWLPEGGKVADLGTGVSTLDFSMLVYFPESETLQVYSGEKTNGIWSITPRGTPFETVSMGQDCQIIKQQNEVYLVKHFETIELVDMNNSPQNTVMGTCAAEDHIVADPYRSGNWYLYGRDSGFQEHYDQIDSPYFYNRVIYPGYFYYFNEYPYADLTLWQFWSPFFVAKARNQIFAEYTTNNEEHPELIYSAHTGDGSSINRVELAKDISTTHSYFFAARDTWDCYDAFQNRFLTINTDSDTLTKRVVFQVGTGHSPGNILAMDTSPDGNIHVLCEQLDSLEIITIDPTTGDRTLAATNLSRDFLPAISSANGTTFHLFKERGVDNGGTLETTLELCELSLGSQPDNYTISSIDSFITNVTPQDLSFSNEGEGSVLYTSRSEIFFAQSSEGTFATYPPVSGQEQLQSRLQTPLSSGVVELYGTFPPSIREYNPNSASLAQKELFYEIGADFIPDLDFPADFTSSPDESTFYLSSFLATRIYAIDGSTGELTLFSNGRPSGLPGDKWGAPALTEPVICCGPSVPLPDHSQNSSNASSWFPIKEEEQ